jgi:hypothetical protein
MHHHPKFQFMFGPAWKEIGFVVADFYGQVADDELDRTHGPAHVVRPLTQAEIDHLKNNTQVVDDDCFNPDLVTKWEIVTYPQSDDLGGNQWVRVTF